MPTSASNLSSSTAPHEIRGLAALTEPHGRAVAAAAAGRHTRSRRRPADGGAVLYVSRWRKACSASRPAPSSSNVPPRLFYPSGGSAAWAAGAVAAGGVQAFSLRSFVPLAGGGTCVHHGGTRQPSPQNSTQGSKTLHEHGMN